jgi:hypothetical protein
MFNVYNKIKRAKSRAAVSLSRRQEKVLILANILSKEVGTSNDETLKTQSCWKNKTVSKSCNKKAKAGGPQKISANRKSASLLT